MTKEDTPAAPRGAPGSGRAWKITQTKRSSAASSHRSGVIDGRNLAFNASMGVRAARRDAKAVFERLSAEKAAAAAAVKAKREEKQRRRAANELRSAKVQVISDPSKLKRMSKKQLRSVKRTTIDAKGRMQLVGAYE